MTDHVEQHDPICKRVAPDIYYCICDVLGEARDDERERVATALVANYKDHRGPVNLSAVLRIIGATRGDAT